MTIKASLRATAAMVALMLLPPAAIGQPLYGVPLGIIVNCSNLTGWPLYSWDEGLAVIETCYRQRKAANFNFCQGLQATPLHFAQSIGPDTHSQKHYTTFSRLASSPTGHCSDWVTVTFCDAGYVWNDTKSFCVPSAIKPEKMLGGVEPGLCVGNPINVGTGNKYERVRDYQGTGPYPLRVERHYNSTAGVQSGALGAHWRHYYERSLTRIGNTVWAYREDGKQVRFTLGADGQWRSEPDVTLRLMATTDANGLQDGWTVRTAADEQERYELADGRLLSIRNRAGHSHTLVYQQGRLQSVADDFGRTLTFEYTSEGVNITDPANEVFGYIQDSEKRLVTVRYPDARPDDGDNPSKHYLYENAQWPKALTGVIDENGARFATWSYDSKGRAVSSEHAGAAQRTTIEYDRADGSVAVTDPSGTQSVLTLEAVHGVLRPSSADRPCPASRGQFANITYDANGFVRSRTDFNGNQTAFVHDARGLQILRTEALGTAEERTITTEWHPDFRLPTRINEPGKSTRFVYDAQGRLVERNEEPAP